MGDNCNWTARYTGLANIRNQLHTCALREGFSLTVMIAGECGLGKSTLINSMFNAEIFELGKERELPSTIEIESSTVKLEEKGVQLEVTIIDTPGYGGQVNNTDLVERIVNEVHARNSAHLENEGRVIRSVKPKDPRVHACIYMVQPDPHGLQRIDLEFLLKMHKIVNVVIGIAKADTLTAGEISAVKAAISADIQRHDIELYTPEADFDTNMEIDTQTATDGQTSSVFSVFSSTKRVKVDGNLMLGREYPWGSITITNEKISDFTKLRNMLVCSHMLDLIDRTNLLYEQFRTDELLKLGLTNTTSLMNEFKIKDDKLQEQLKAIEDMSQKLICKVENDAAAQYEDAYKLYEDNQRDLLARLTKEKEKMQAYEVLTKAPMRVARTG